MAKVRVCFPRPGALPQARLKEAVGHSREQRPTSTQTFGIEFGVWPFTQAKPHSVLAHTSGYQATGEADSVGLADPVSLPFHHAGCGRHRGHFDFRDSEGTRPRRLLRRRRTSQIHRWRTQNLLPRIRPHPRIRSGTSQLSWRRLFANSRAGRQIC